MDDFTTWFRDYMDHWYGFAKEQIEGGGEMLPALMVVAKGGLQVAVMPVDMERKDETFALHVELGRPTHIVDGAVLFCEAWTLDAGKLEPGETAADVLRRHDRQSLEDNPDAVEVVLWSARRGDALMLAKAVIITGADSKRTLLPYEIIEVDPDRAAGRMVTRPA